MKIIKAISQIIALLRALLLVLKSGNDAGTAATLRTVASKCHECANELEGDVIPPG